MERIADDTDAEAPGERGKQLVELWVSQLVQAAACALAMLPPGIPLEGFALVGWSGPGDAGPFERILEEED